MRSTPKPTQSRIASTTVYPVVRSRTAWATWSSGTGAHPRVEAVHVVGCHQGRPDGGDHLAVARVDEGAVDHLDVAVVVDLPPVGALAAADEVDRHRVPRAVTALGQQAGGGAPAVDLHVGDLGPGGRLRAGDRLDAPLRAGVARELLEGPLGVPGGALRRVVGGGELLEEGDHLVLGRRGGRRGRLRDHRGPARCTRPARATPTSTTTDVRRRAPTSSPLVRIPCAAEPTAARDVRPPRRPQRCRQRYWPVFETVSMVRPGSVPFLPWMIVRM